MRTMISIQDPHRSQTTCSSLRCVQSSNVYMTLTLQFVRVLL